MFSLASHCHGGMDWSTALQTSRAFSTEENIWGASSALSSIEYYYFKLYLETYFALSYVHVTLININESQIH